MRRARIWVGPTAVKEIAERFRNCSLANTKYGPPFFTDISEGTEHVDMTVDTDDRIGASKAIQSVVPWVDSVVFPGSNKPR